MKTKHAGWAIALAAVLSAPAFAQNAVVSSSGPVVTSGTGVVVTPGVATTSAASPGLLPGYSVVPGAVVAQAGSSTSVSGNTTTTTTRYWVNVPSGVERDKDFQRWQRLQ